MRRAIKAAEALVNLFHQNGDKGLQKSDTYINFNCAKQCAILSIEQTIVHVLRIDTIENMEELAHLRRMKEAVEAMPDMQ